MNARAVRFVVLASAVSLCILPCVGDDAVIAFPAEGGVEVPPLGEIRRLEVRENPAVPPYEVRPDLSNVIGYESLPALPEHARTLLAENGFCIVTSGKSDLYELYEPNPSPFVTSDCVFHVYSVLLTDTLRRFEGVYMVEQLERFVAGAHRQAQSLLEAVPKPLRPAAERSVAFYAVAHRLLDPMAAVDVSVQNAVEQEVDRILEAQFIGRLEGGDRTLDYTVFEPIVGYEDSEALQRYYRASKYLSFMPVPFKTQEDVQTCLLVSAAAWVDPETRQVYLDLIRVGRFLSGTPEDPTPLQVLQCGRRVFGESSPVGALVDEQKVRALKEQIESLPKPRVADQPQERPGADPLVGLGVRVLSPGITIRALAFQEFGKKGRDPSGRFMAHVLGNEAVEMRKGDRGLLEPFRELLDAAASGPLEDTDLHTNGLVVLSKLSQVVGEGYPGFMSSKAWPTKTANTQMGAWSQTEHAVYLYAKDTAVYPSAYDDETRFHGYVEPVPAYYAALWSLVHRTRTAFEELGIFERIAGLETRSREDPLGRSAVVPTPEHFTTLEDVLLKLKGMSEKELEGKPFDESENALLKSFGWKLKYLSFNESTSAHAREPMAIVVRIAREYLEKKGLYVGVGRPLAVYVVVPWMGTLQWAKGGVYSYYEFMRPLRAPLTDEQWKQEVMAPYAVQPQRPWLFEKGVGVDPIVWPEEKLATWLEAQQESVHFQSTLRWRQPDLVSFPAVQREMDDIGYVALSKEALRAAGEAFATPWDGGYETRAVLYCWMRDAPEDIRKSRGLEVVGVIAEYLRECPLDIYPEYHPYWLRCSIDLLHQYRNDPEVATAVSTLMPVLEKHNLLEVFLRHDTVREVFEAAQQQQEGQ